MEFSGGSATVGQSAGAVSLMWGCRVFQECLPCARIHPNGVDKSRMARAYTGTGAFS
jgi:hypothetical protein